MYNLPETRVEIHGDPMLDVSMPFPTKQEFVSLRVQLAAALAISIYSILISASAATSSCYSSTLNWYIDAIGETPCMTYQRLRQICNPTYTTPTWTINSTTDTCDDENSECCCNSIAWSLRMLCLNCQWDWFGTPDPGYGANAYGYYHWRWSGGSENNGTYCGPGRNQTLSDTLQQEVCDQGVRLDNFLYTIFSYDGSWTFTEFETQAESVLGEHPNNPNETLYCWNSSMAEGALGSSSGTITTSSMALGLGATSSPTYIEQKTSTVAVVGGTLGGAMGLMIFGGIAAMFYVKTRRLRQLQPTTNMLLEDDARRGQTNNVSLLVKPSRSQPVWPRHLYTRTPSESAGAYNTVDLLGPSSSIVQLSQPTSAADNRQGSIGPLIDPRIYPEQMNTTRRDERVRRDSRRTAIVSPRPEVHAFDAETIGHESQLPPEYCTVYMGSA